MSVIRAWDDNSLNVKSVTDEILQCLFVPHPFLADVVLSRCSFHPDFQDRSSQIQREMLGGLSTWLQSLGHQQSAILARLSKQAVRDHKNVRLGSEGGSPASQGTTSNAGSQMQANTSGYSQGIPGMAQAQGLYNQFSGGLGGRRSGNESYGPGATIGPSTRPEAVPPAVPIFSRPSGGQAGNFYEDAPPFSSQPYISYPGGPSSDMPPPPQAHPPRRPHSPSSYQGRAYGFAPPTQPGFPVAPEQSSYLPPGSSFTEPGLPIPHTGGPPSNSWGSPYPGTSYPGQSYPGQQGTGIQRIPGPGNINSAYSSSPLPSPNFPGTAPSFPSEGGRRFPDPQYDSVYGSGSGSDSRYGHGTRQPDY